jgi:polysaccharide biosynthesis transport protein
MTGTTETSTEEDAPPLAEFLAHLRAGARRAALIAGSIGAAALLIAALVPPRFHATATLAVLPAPEFTVRQEAGARAFNNSALAMDQIMKAETEILQSDDLHASTLAAAGVATIYPALDPAATPSLPLRLLHGAAHVLLSPWRVPPADPLAALQDQALRRFNNDLRVLPAKDSNVITVSFANRDGTVTSRVVNLMLARYAEQRGHLYDDPQLAVVQRESDGLAHSLREAETNLASYKFAHAISDSGTERALLLRRQSDTTQALADAETAAAEQQARLASLRRQIHIMPPTVSLYQENDPDTRLQAIDASLVDLHGQLAAARVHYRDSSRKIIDLLTQLHQRQRERSQLEKPGIPSVSRQGRTPSIDPLLLDRAHAATEAVAAIARAASLRTELTTITAALQQLSSEETILADLTRRRDLAANNYANASHVLAEQRLTEAEDALRMANVRVIQSARPPQHPAPVPLLICLAGALLGTLTALAWLVVGFATRPTFLTPAGLAYATGLPVLGVFPAPAAAGAR